MRRIFSIISLLCLLACTPDDPTPPPIPAHYFVLTAYEENKTIYNTFDYEDDQLIQQSFIEEDEIRTIQFVYRDDGLVDSVYIRQSWFPRNLKFHYEDTLIMEWEVWNLANSLVQWVLLERDDQGRIIEMSRVSYNYGLVYTYTFNWDGSNISDYEMTWFSEYENMTYHYEFKYDHYINPYNSTFQKIGINFQHFFPFPLPLTKNNPIEEMSYLKSNPEKTRIVLKNKYFYVGHYPYIRESYVHEGDSIRKIYGVFRYKKIML